MKKKLLAMLVSMTMVVGLLTGCGSSSDSGDSGSAGESASEEVELQDFTIATTFPESGLTSFEILANNAKQLCEAAGGTFVNAPADMTADGILSFVESQIAAGTKGLVFCPNADSVLPTVTTLCEEAGVYWGICMRSIEDEEIKELVEASPYYVGNCYESEEETGYNAGKWMGEAGYKKIAIISQPKGDTTCDAREEGLAKACEEYGMEIVSEARGLSQASDATSATESFLAANADLDVIFYVGSPAAGVHEATVKAIQDAGRDVKMTAVDFPSEMVEDFESGIMTYGIGLSCLTYDPYMVVVKLINAIQGYPLNDDGTPTSNLIEMFEIDNLDDAKKYMEVSGDNTMMFYEGEDMEQLFKWNNPEMSEDYMQKLIEDFNPLNN
jgi:ABC-type sugar transport system substrate-binding protein